MRLFVYLASLTLLPFTVSCTDQERLSRLERKNAELKAEVAKRSAVASFDMQQRCSSAAKKWFAENMSQEDQPRLSLDYSNHFNLKRNGCYIFVQYQTPARVGSSTAS